MRLLTGHAQVWAAPSQCLKSWKICHTGTGFGDVKMGEWRGLPSHWDGSASIPEGPPSKDLKVFASSPLVKTNGLKAKET